MVSEEEQQQQEEREEVSFTQFTLFTLYSFPSTRHPRAAHCQVRPADACHAPRAVRDS